jgi:serine/threonine protein kinase
VVGRYRLDSELGRGGMGVVYRATDLESGRVVALKSLLPNLTDDRRIVKRFRREARAALAINHPNVVQMLDVIEHDGVALLAMEFLSGESLERVLERRGHLPVGEVSEIMIRVISAVGTAHALGIVHRDLKPDNVLVVGDGGAHDVKVLDFGIAKLTATEGSAAQTEALTQTGALMGTPFYMSPEQAFGEKRIDQRSDVWSLGIILYRALTGVLPTYGETFADVYMNVVKRPFRSVREVRPELPEDVSALVMRMLERDCDKRPWDLREVYDVLARYAEASAPTFGEAVEPVFEEPSTGDATTQLEAARTPSPESRSPLRLSPPRLQLPAAHGPSGTVVMDSGTIRMTPEALGRSGAPPRSRRVAFALGGVVVLAMILVALLAR